MDCQVPYPINKEPTMKKVKLFLVIGESLLLISLAITNFSFAWFDSKERQLMVNSSTSTLAVTNISTDVYKYVYANIGTVAVPIYDYNNPGTVTKTTIPNDATSVIMNIFDPTLLKISADKTISDLNTNLVLKVSFHLSYATKVNLVVLAQEDTITTTNLLASNYVHFTALTSDTYTTYAASSGITDNDANALLFKNIKQYSEDVTNHPYYIFPDAVGATGNDNVSILNKDTSSNYVELVTVTPTAQTEGDYFFYINLDYDDNLTNGKINSSATENTDYSLYTDARLGQTFAVDMDYHFVLTFNQA